MLEPTFNRKGYARIYYVVAIDENFRSIQINKRPYLDWERAKNKKNLLLEKYSGRVRVVGFRLHMSEWKEYIKATLRPVK